MPPWRIQKAAYLQTKDLGKRIGRVYDELAIEISIRHDAAGQVHCPPYLILFHLKHSLYQSNKVENQKTSTYVRSANVDVQSSFLQYAVTL